MASQQFSSRIRVRILAGAGIPAAADEDTVLLHVHDLRGRDRPGHADPIRVGSQGSGEALAADADAEAGAGQGAEGGA